MARLHHADLIRCLRDVVAPQDEVVALFSGVWTFAHQFGWPAREIGDRLLDAVLEAVGDGRTLVLPAYTFSFARTRRFDPDRDPPEIGLLPAAAFRRPGFRRTPKPVYSHMVTGPRSAELLALPATTAWGEDAVLGWLARHDARVCILGVAWHEACTLYHCAEEIRRVPYRYYKRLAGTLTRSGAGEEPCEEVIYVRSLDVPANTEYSRIRPRFTETAGLRAGRDVRVPVESAGAVGVVEAGVALLAEDPYACVRNVDEVRRWVADGKADEIARLRPDERPADS